MTEVDNSPLVIFRVFFGLLIMAESIGAIFTGWVHNVFIKTDFTFTFIGFEWLEPLPGDGMLYYFAGMGAAGLLVTLGLFYRFGAAVFAIMWSGVYLMQKSAYNNHYYLLMLLAFAMVLMPAHKRFSLDAKFGFTRPKDSCPRVYQKFWVVHVVMVYLFASFNKMHVDWLQGHPISIWFAHKSDMFLIGGLLMQQWFQTFIAWGGVMYDGLVGPLLLNKRTRPFAFGLSIFFNLFNSIVFQIGIFPYLMLAFTLFFYPPETISRIFFRRRLPATPSLFRGRTSAKALSLGAFWLYFVVQGLLPLRHFLFEGDVHWTEEGHRLSWQMMLRNKSGSISFRVVNNQTQMQEFIDKYPDLSRKQVNKLATHPDFVWQYVQRLKVKYREKGWTDFSIYAIGYCQLNKRERGPMIDPNYDLVNAEWSPFKSHDWIIKKAPPIQKQYL